MLHSKWHCKAHGDHHSAPPPGTLGKAQALVALQAFKHALKDETSGIPLGERLSSASRAQEKDFDLTSTKVFLSPPPHSKGNLWIASKSMSPPCGPLVDLHYGMLCMAC